MGSMELLIIPLIYLLIRSLFGRAGERIAVRKGRHNWRWFRAAFIGGVLVLILLLIVPRIVPQPWATGQHDV